MLYDDQLMMAVSGRRSRSSSEYPSLKFVYFENLSSYIVLNTNKSNAKTFDLENS